MKSKNLVRASLVLALLVVLDLTGIGIIRIPALPAFTILHVPVIVASIAFGPKIGMVSGFGFGLISFFEATFRPGSPIDMLFSPFTSDNPIASIIMTFVPRIILGLIPFYIYKLLSGKIGSRFSVLISAIISTVVHSTLVLTALAVFFKEIPLASLFITIVSLNTLLETVAAAIIATALAPPLMKNF